VCLNSSRLVLAGWYREQPAPIIATQKIQKTLSFIERNALCETYLLFYLVTKLPSSSEFQIQPSKDGKKFPPSTNLLRVDFPFFVPRIEHFFWIEMSWLEQGRIAFESGLASDYFFCGYLPFWAPVVTGAWQN
jgi:hypothetical protein